MMNFRTIMVSDGNAALSQEARRVIDRLYNRYGDVMDTDMIIASLQRVRSSRAA